MFLYNYISENMGRNIKMIKSTKMAYQTWRSFHLNIWTIAGLIHVGGYDFKALIVKIDYECYSLVD